MPMEMHTLLSTHCRACRIPAHARKQRAVTAAASSAGQRKDVFVVMLEAHRWHRGVTTAAAHLCAVEPEAAQAVEDLGLQEADPARVQLHDDGKGGVGREDDVVDHGRVVAHPDMVGPVDWTWPVIPAGAVSE